MENNETTKLAFASSFLTPYDMDNPWTSNDYDKMDVFGRDEYQALVEEFRFFYKREPLASTTLNKIIEISVNDILVDQGDMSDNEYRVIESILGSIQTFIENCALELLVTGLCIPEIKYTTVGKKILEQKGIKRFSNLYLPTNMWVRDSGLITIKESMLNDEPTYYVKVPDEMIFFIQSEGTFPDGLVDKELYEKLKAIYPTFVEKVRKGDLYIKIEDNKNIIRYRYMPDSPYPLGYLFAALEPLKHKRNIRRMDYSTAARVIGAIQLVKLGSDLFPVTEEDTEQFDSIRNQMRHRDDKNIERIFQLFTNHTVDISWVFPDTTALLDDSKYQSVNQDIIYSLGFPRILITGETERSNTSDPEYAVVSPENTLRYIRRKLLGIVEDIIFNVIELNGIKHYPSNIRFANVNLQGFAEFTTAIEGLYGSGNLSRTHYAETLGYSLEEEFKLRKEEKELLEEYGISEFDAVPFSPPPGDAEVKSQNDTKKIEKEKE